MLRTAGLARSALSCKDESDSRPRLMLGCCQARKECIADTGVFIAAEISEEPHAVETGPPGGQDFRSRGAVEGKFGIGKRQGFLDGEPRPHQNFLEPPPHKEIIPAGLKSLVRVRLEPLCDAAFERGMPEQVVDLGQRDPAASPQMPCPRRKDRTNTRKVRSRKAAPDPIHRNNATRQSTKIGLLKLGIGDATCLGGRDHLSVRVETTDLCSASDQQFCLVSDSAAQIEHDLAG